MNIDWDDAFDNVGHIPEAGKYPAMWAERARVYRESADFAELDIPYGNHAREKYDLFRPSGPARGLLVFIHGGYWIRLDKSYWSHLAEGARQHGWAVAIPSYVQAPEARISQITSRTAEAITHACDRVQGPVRLVGHSAGGHLVTRMICKNSPLPKSISERIEHVMSISGLYDLRPLLHTGMNRTLGLTGDEANAESPFLQQPMQNVALTAWVGGEERPEFIRQLELITDGWSRTGMKTKAVIDTGHHHFSVIEGLADAGSDITKNLLSPDNHEISGLGLPAD